MANANVVAVDVKDADALRAAISRRVMKLTDAEFSGIWEEGLKTRFSGFLGTRSLEDFKKAHAAFRGVITPEVAFTLLTRADSSELGLPPETTIRTTQQIIGWVGDVVSFNGGIVVHHHQLIKLLGKMESLIKAAKSAKAPASSK